MTRDELFSKILTICPRTGDLVYIERRGGNYAWSRTTPGDSMPAVSTGNDNLPDVWIYYSGRWPVEDEDSDYWRGFFDDLLAEMEAMAGGADRCRWPLNDPWPHGH